MKFSSIYCRSLLLASKSNQHVSDVALFLLANIGTAQKVGLVRLTPRVALVENVGLDTIQKISFFYINSEHESPPRIRMRGASSEGSIKIKHFSVQDENLERLYFKVYVGPKSIRQGPKCTPSASEFSSY